MVVVHLQLGVPMGPFCHYQEVFSELVKGRLQLMVLTGRAGRCLCAVWFCACFGVPGLSWPPEDSTSLGLAPGWTNLERNVI